MVDTPMRERTEAEASGSDVRVRLYDAEGRDRDVDLDDVPELAPHRLLWVDVRGLDPATLRDVGARFAIEHDTLERLRELRGRPKLEEREGYLFVRVLSVNEVGGDVPAEKIDCLVGDNWILTAHETPLQTLELFDETVRRPDSIFGRLSSRAFLASLLDWQVTTYLRALERFEDEVDDLDELLLANDDPGDDLLERMVTLRGRITKLRRALAPHREVFAALAQPAQVGDESEDTIAHFRLLVERLQHAIETTENARDMLLGSFDVFMTQTDQRTNQVVKLLTVVTATALPATVIAGIMGMSVRASVYSTPVAFWIALALIVGSMATVVIVARRRGWL